MSTHDPRPDFNSPQPQPQWQGPGPVGNGTPPTQPAGPGPYSRPNAMYGTPQVFTPRSAKTKPARARLGVASLLAVALLSAGVGGGAALTADRMLSVDQATATTTSTATTSATQVVQADPSSPDWTAVADSVSGAVVAIQVVGPNESGQGSGVILDSDGTIVTNNHVIGGGGADTKIRVVIANKAYEATVVGTDPSTDLAVIRVIDPPSDLKTVSFANSAELVVGEPVMAIGNPLGLSDTVTTGIVSALNRPVTTRAVSPAVGDQGNGVVVTAAVQTSAAINPGNSGGALLNTSGELIGINSSIATLSGGSTEQSGSIGIGFAIGSDQVRYITDQLIASGTAEHARMGVSASDNSTNPQLGAEVAEVVPGSSAADAGIQVGDVVTAVDDLDVTSSQSLVALVRNARVGQDVNLTLVRDGSAQQISVTLGSDKN